MTTFSQMVDKMVAESGRPDLLVEICSYLNQTIRELHFEPTKGNAVFYRENRKEVSLTAVSDGPLFWDIPNPTTFQGLAAVQYPSAGTRHYASGGLVWAKEIQPGPAMNTEKYYWYRAGGRHVFNGFGGINAQVNLSWFEFPRSLSYFTVNDRPAIYTEEDGWVYQTPSWTADQKLAAQLRVSNWLLLRWPIVIEEGLRAKIYKRTSDDSRARTAYSMYTSQRQGLYSSEVAVLGGT